MFSSLLKSRMTLSLVSLVASAAISACGGGAPADMGTDGTAQDSATSVGSIAAQSLAGTTSSTSGATDTPTSAVAAAPSTSTDSAPAAAPASAAIGASAGQTIVNTGSQSTPAAVAQTDIVPRPAYNTGPGFYIVGTKLYDSTGHEFRPRGLNRVHWNQAGDDVGIPATGANTERLIMDFRRKPADNVALMQKQMINMGVVPMPGNWTGTCKADTASIRAIVDTWVAQAPDFTTLDRYSIINIANEWGPSDSTVWRDEYIAAIARMRAAGYKGTLSITSGGCGQDQNDLIKYAQAVFDSDPEKNILFDLHVYGHFQATQSASWQTLFSTAMQKVAALHLPILIGEFGPGKNLGPSPTMLTPQQIVSTAESLGFGWLAWAYDANDGYNCTASEYSYAIVKKCGTYKTDADLTGYGLTIVPMLKSMATHAQVFQ